MPKPSNKKSLTDLSNPTSSAARPFSDDEEDLKTSKGDSMDVPKINLNFNEVVFQSSPIKKMPPKGEASARNLQGTRKGNMSSRKLLQLHKSDDFTNAAFNKLATPKNAIQHKVIMTVDNNM